MTNTEQKIFEIIRRNRNKTASTRYIARYSGESTSYVNLVCQGLCRRGHINFVRGLAIMPALADVSTDDSPPQPPAEEAETQESPAESEDETAEESPAQAFPISSLDGLSSELVKALEGAGCSTVANLAEMPVAKLMSASGIDLKQAADLINQARRKIGTIA